jgi:hypothetical protein
MNAASFDSGAARGLRAPSKFATPTYIGYFRTRLQNSIVTLTQLSVPRIKIAWPANEIVSLFVDAWPRLPSSDAARNDASIRACLGYLPILILTGEFTRYAKRSILFFPLLQMPLSAQRRRRNGIKSYSVRDKELFSFVASIGRQKGRCVPKQGDCPTIL